MSSEDQITSLIEITLFVIKAPHSTLDFLKTPYTLLLLSTLVI